MSLFTVCLVIVALLVLIPIVYWILQGLFRGIQRAGGSGRRRGP
jgi:hypothetical protein